MRVIRRLPLLPRAKLMQYLGDAQCSRQKRRHQGQLLDATLWQAKKTRDPHPMGENAKDFGGFRWPELAQHELQWLLTGCCPRTLPTEDELVPRKRLLLFL